MFQALFGVVYADAGTLVITFLHTKDPVFAVK